MFANTQQGFNNCFKADPSKPSYERATTPSASPQFIQLPHASISTLWCHQICLKTTLNMPITLLTSQLSFLILLFALTLRKWYKYYYRCKSQCWGKSKWWEEADGEGPSCPSSPRQRGALRSLGPPQGRTAWRSQVVGRERPPAAVLIASVPTHSLHFEELEAFRAALERPNISFQWWEIKMADSY